MFQAATKSWTNFLLGVGAGVDFGEGAELGVGAEDEIDARAGPLDGAGLAVAAFEEVGVAGEVGFHSVPMSSRLTKKSLVSASGRLVKTPCLRLAGVGVEDAQAADEHGHLGGGQGQQLGLVDQQVLRRGRCTGP